MNRVSVCIAFMACRMLVFTAACAINPPAIEWQRSYGGTNGDILYALERGAQGELLMAGVATLPGYWLLRTDSAGNPLAEIRHRSRNLYRDDDVAIACKMLPDRGVYLAGFSHGGAIGSKSSTNFGGSDYWVLRLDASGNKVWDQSFGGSDLEHLASMALSEDGGCLLGGTSYSRIGGNKTSPGFGNGDYWVVRVGSDGTKLWEKSFGTTNTDVLGFVLPTSGNGYLLGGYSFGTPSGTTGSRTNTGFGSLDYWVIRIDGEGNRLWEAAYGGSDFE